MIIEHKKVKYGHDPRTYGGTVLFKDFSTGYGNKGSDNTHGSEYASRIVYDMRFDQNCQRKPKTTSEYEPRWGYGWR